MIIRDEEAYEPMIIWSPNPMRPQADVEQDQDSVWIGHVDNGLSKYA